jgi:lipopolysaccharide export system protein LptA
MRSLRWLLLLAMVGVAVAVVFIYRTGLRRSRAHRVATPAALGLDLSGASSDYEWSQNGKTHVKVKAKDQTISADQSRIQLKDVELQIFQKDDKKYDRVRTPEAVLIIADHKLYAPGEAEITLDVPAQGEPPHPLTSIKAASVNFDSQSGKAVTDKHVSFTFDGGSGTSEGASYDPDTHALQLNSNVVLNLKGKTATSQAMKVEAGELIYSEKDGMVHLGPWSRMTRADTVIDAGVSNVKLLDKKMDTVDAVAAKGTDKRPGRQLEYAADAIHIHYVDGAADKITGTGNARLVSHGKGSDTTMTGNVVDLFFNTESGDSELSSAIARGNGMVESKPTPDPKGVTPDTKILKADTLDLHMQPGGKDLARVHTQAPGTLEFLPNQIARHRRVLKANEMNVLYGEKNEIQSFHAIAASTETYPSEEERRRHEKEKKTTPLDVGYTSSKTIDAAFDEKGQLKTMKQTDDFHYAEGARKAQSDFATLDNAKNLMDLVNHARISDDSGTTIADNIQLNQTTGDFDAKGHVSTTRLPDPKKNSSDMLDKDEALQGMADRVISADRNKIIHYAGNAVLWQSANRIQADKIDVDRDKKSIVADGQVVSQFKDKDKEAAVQPVPGKPGEKAKPSVTAPIFTIVKATHMVYTDQDRLALYTGGTNFWRAKLTVKSTTLRAWLNPDDSDSDSRINRAFADGKVEIVQVAPDRTRVGNSDHAEYYADDGKVVLTEGDPKLSDSIKGRVDEADKLTYYTDDDRLIVEGTSKKQVKTHLLKKKKP